MLHPVESPHSRPLGTTLAIHLQSTLVVLRLPNLLILECPSSQTSLLFYCLPLREWSHAFESVRILLPNLRLHPLLLPLTPHSYIYM